MAQFARPPVLDAIRETLEALRRRIEAGDAPAPPPVDIIMAEVRERLTAGDRDRIRYAINATGILLHTGLGRAPLAPAATQALGRLAGCANMQIDLATGLRGKRSATTEALLCRLTGAEAALVVNNNAGATLLVLAALCEGREVVVSRGQLIEIGGSYRLPDCITRSGARMIEVGTTNKTHLRDYAQAIGPETAALLRVNPSNYRIVGFSKEVSIRELTTLKQDHPDLLVLDDLGCGALVPMERYGLPAEPTVPDSITAGADLAFFSGDKLIGGPQAGILVGRRDLIEQIRKHPLTRMLRICKLTDMALQETLRLFLTPETLPETNHVYRMLTVSLNDLRQRAESIREAALARAENLEMEIVSIESAMGGGSMPATSIPSIGLAVSSGALRPEMLSHRLRDRETPVIARIESDAVILDMRTLLPGEESELIEALVTLTPPKESMP